MDSKRCKIEQGYDNRTCKLSDFEFNKEVNLYVCPTCLKEYSKHGICNHFWRNHTEEGRNFIPNPDNAPGGWNKGLTKETDEQVAKGAKSNSKTKNTEGYIHSGYCSKDYHGSKKHIESSRRGGGYRKNAGRSRGDYVNDSFGKRVYLQSSYELRCAEILDNLSINWIRPNFLKYELDNKQKKYYPDFYLVDLNIYLDPKNSYLITIDKRKIEAVIKQNVVDIRILSENMITEECLGKLMVD